MAQWLGQFSGNTHATRVQAATEALTKAIGALSLASSDSDRQRKYKNVRKLAGRLLAARLKLLRARLADLKIPTECGEKPGSGLQALKEREASTTASGIEGILAEFGVTHTN